MKAEAEQTRSLMDAIRQAPDRTGLAGLARKIPSIQAHLVEAGLEPARIEEAVSDLGEAVTRRMATLAEESLGPPPSEYALLVAGSLARREQIAGADQDNAILLDQPTGQARPEDYFTSLGEWICGGLDESGFTLCAGQVMAGNPQWCQPLATWKGYFETWIETPDPKALLHASIFFDLRCVHGRADLFETLQTSVLERTRTSPLFQSHMAASALQHGPALRLNRFIRFDRTDRGPTVNLKAGGVTPVVDLARVHTLAAGLAPVGTRQRLAALETAGLLNPSDCRALKDAFDCISRLRLMHQARQIRVGEPPDYRVPRDRLNPADRRALGRALRTVSRMQAATSRAFQAREFT